MIYFLGTIIILGLVEVGASIAYWVTGVVPKRTVSGALFNGACFCGLAAWAIYLLPQAA